MAKARWFSERSKASGFVACVLAYVTAAAGALAAAYLLRDLHPIALLAGADVAATVVVFGFSVYFNNSSIYDPFWSLSPVAIGGAFLLWAAPETSTVRQGLVLCLVLFWGARLTFNWARSWQGLAHEDWRYINIRRTAGRAYWGASFLGIHLLPTVVVFLGCLPLWTALARGTRPLGLLDAAAFCVTLSAIIIETVADKQLYSFRSKRTHHTEILNTGIWALCRHPNYFGEILFWWGLCLFGLAAAPASVWVAIGAVSVTALFLTISIPMIEKRMLARRPGYATRQKRVSLLIPWFPKG